MFYIYSLTDSILYWYGCSRCCSIWYILYLDLRADCLEVRGNQEILFASIVLKTCELVPPSRSSLTTFCRDCAVAKLYGLRKIVMSSVSTVMKYICAVIWWIYQILVKSYISCKVYLFHFEYYVLVRHYFVNFWNN